MKLTTLLAATFFIAGYNLAHSHNTPPPLAPLLDELAFYKLTNPNFHAGDLLQHSLWVGRAIARWFDEKHPLTAGLIDHQKQLVIAGLIHDIGKAGDEVFFYPCKPCHPYEGAEYLLSNKPLLLTDGTILNVTQLLKKCALTSLQLTELALIIAIHLDFGWILRDLRHGNTDQTPAQLKLNYIAKFLRLCQELNLQPTQRRLDMCILVSMADIRGIQPESYSNHLLRSLVGPFYADSFCRACYSGYDVYNLEDCETRGLTLRTQLARLLSKKS